MPADHVAAITAAIASKVSRRTFETEWTNLDTCVHYHKEKQIKIVVLLLELATGAQTPVAVLHPSARVTLTRRYIKILPLPNHLRSQVGHPKIFVRFELCVSPLSRV